MRKGSTFERRVADYLARWWEFADRRVKTGAKDKGDIAGIPGWTLECKYGVRDLSAGVNEARVEAVNAGTRWWAAVIRKPGAVIERSYVVLDLEEWAELARRLEFLERSAIIAGRSIAGS